MVVRPIFLTSVILNNLCSETTKRSVMASDSLYIKNVINIRYYNSTSAISLEHKLPILRSYKNENLTSREVFEIYHNILRVF